MARTINTEKTKKKSKLKIFLIVLLILLVIAGGAFLVWKLVFDKEETGTAVQVKELDNLSDYSYVLTDRDSSYYKSEFEELKKIVNVDEVDEEAYAVQVARMFIIDLYTMNTKVNKYDIGGIEFIHIDAKDKYEKKVMDTLYSQMLDDTYGDRKQVLPEVNSLETISTETLLPYVPPFFASISKSPITTEAFSPGPFSLYSSLYTKSQLISPSL